MASKKMTTREKELTRRYLIWCYKTTKESLDRIDRYFTQLQVDKVILRELTKSKEYKSPKKNFNYNKLVADFILYMERKESNVTSRKYVDPAKKEILPNYLYLQNRFKAIEKSIVQFLGKAELTKINKIYEEEMTKRIFAAREHR